MPSSNSHKSGGPDRTASASQLWDDIKPTWAGNVNEENSCHTRPVGMLANYGASWQVWWIVISLFRHSRAGGRLRWNFKCWVCFFSCSAYLRKSVLSADSQTACGLVPLCYRLVKVVALTRQSETKCQSVCTGQTVNVCNYVLPYAVYRGWERGWGLMADDLQFDGWDTLHILHLDT